MNQLEEAERAIDGVGRLALFDRKGVEGFGRDKAAAARSFLAYALVVPVFALLIAADVTMSETETPGLLTAAEIIGETIKIAGFPLLMILVLRLYRRGERWPWFVTAYNWFNAAQIVLSLGAFGLRVQGLGPWPVLFFLIYAWVVEAFMAESVLDIGALRAAGIVLLDIFFSFAVDKIAYWIGGA